MEIVKEGSSSRIVISKTVISPEVRPNRSALITDTLITDYFRASSVGILARKQTEVTKPVPEQKPYPYHYEASNPVTDQKREGHCRASEPATG